MQAERIKRLLPEIYQAAAQPGTVLDALLGVMEVLHEPVERHLDQLDAVFDPRRADDRFLRMLASWVALDSVLEGPASAASERRSRAAIAQGNLRELVAETVNLARSRGTSRSLRRFLELATGLSGFDIQDAPAGPDGRAQPFAARIIAPAEAASIAPLIERIVASEKPAFTTVEIVYQGGSASNL
jgi:phage tail-like protein